MNSKERILEYLEKKGISKREFYASTGLSNGFLDKTNNISADKLEKIISVYKDLNLHYIVTGKGESDSTKKMVSNLVPNMVSNHNILSEPEEEYKRIPLIPVDAMAGWSAGDITVSEIETDRYVVPEFKGVDFLIRVKGSSMYPKYSSGDIVACQYIKESRFIQWGKVYVLDSTQGALVKRLFKSEDKDCIECRSDNKDYPPFDVPKNEVRAMAVVIGVIRLE